jgi:hypothetical protein
MRDGFAEEAAGGGGADELGRLISGHDHDGHDGDPAAKLDFTEKCDGIADAANFAAEAEEWGIEIAEHFVDERGIVLEEGLDGVVGEVRRSDGFEKAEAIEFVAGNFAGGDHGRFAKGKAVKQAIAEGASLLKLGLGLDLFSKELDTASAKALDDGTARVGIGSAEIHLEELG